MSPCATLLKKYQQKYQIYLFILLHILTTNKVKHFLHDGINLKFCGIDVTISIFFIQNDTLIKRIILGYNPKVWKLEGSMGETDTQNWTLFDF
jgi:hypothetical protein